MAKYHEIGRFSKNENDVDWEAALFHEQHAADLGLMEAILTLSKLNLGMQPDVLVNCVVEVRLLRLMGSSKIFRDGIFHGTLSCWSLSYF